VLIGALHDATGAWTVPLLVLLALAVPELAAALAASRPGYVGVAHAEDPHASAEAPVAGRL
jgi:CP family cyanate transporter-like MFS transporter